VLTEIAKETRDDYAWTEQHNKEVEEDQDRRQFRDNQMMKIVRWLRNKNMARKIMNTPLVKFMFPPG
jgi:hypothetical protein